LNGAELTQVQAILSEGEMGLWMKYQNIDKRHSIVVLNRLNVLMPTAGREAQAAALLHDIGKSRSQLGVLLRVVATIVGPRTRRFSQYHRHEEIGIELLESIGSSDVMISLLKGVGDPQVIAALTAADNI
jgi:response regulator RpfG family c-di-GMP phosphodiesterase